MNNKLKREIKNNIVYNNAIIENKKYKRNIAKLQVVTRVKEFDQANLNKAVEFILKSRNLIGFGEESDKYSKREIFMKRTRLSNPIIVPSMNYMNNDNYFELSITTKSFKKSVIDKEILYSDILNFFVDVIKHSKRSENNSMMIKSMFEESIPKRYDNTYYHLQKKWKEESVDFQSKLHYSVETSENYDWFNPKAAKEMCDIFLKYLFNPVDGYVLFSTVSDDNEFELNANNFIEYHYKEIKLNKPFEFEPAKIYFPKNDELIVDTVSSSLLLTRVNFDKRLERLQELNYINEIFGSGFDSWMFKEIREKLEAGYSANGYISGDRRSLYATAGILNSKYDAVIKRIKELFNDLKNGRFSEKKVEDLKTIRIRKLSKIMEEPESLVDTMIYLYWINVESIDEIIELNKKVTKESISKVTSNIIEDLEFAFLKGTKDEKSN